MNPFAMSSENVRAPVPQAPHNEKIHFTFTDHRGDGLTFQLNVMILTRGVRIGTTLRSSRTPFGDRGRFQISKDTFRA